ncbi:MAG: malto-oligosyltrehalose synthase [Opitutaceae bacterium]|nr:malto-oligosyltrehalose synthase [Opitutaceae bacterium]
MRIPRCAYRLQLHGGFTFADAAKLVPYLASLGVSDCYCSPIFTAALGSTHGYDVANFEEINPALGGEVGFLRLSQALKSHNIGLLVDFVPNHMGMCLENPWWRDVLENGRASEYAEFFDIEWRHTRDPERDKITLPLLRDHYGVLLESGALRLMADTTGIYIGEEGIRFPLRAESYARFVEILRSPDDPPLDVSDAGSAKDFVLAKLQSGSDAITTLHRHFQTFEGVPGDPSSFDEIDALIASQHYRLARWQAGIHGTRYRRFFTINTLIALRVDRPNVFARAHAKLKQLVNEGHITGIRIDHIDGLLDPKDYLDQLESVMLGSDGGRPYVVVEKILTGNETLRGDWKADGTTGYEFIATLAGLFTDSRNEAAFNAIYQAFTGESHTYEEAVAANKKRVVQELFRTTFLSLAEKLVSILQIDRRWRDYTVSELSDALKAFVAGFSVYRTYRRDRSPAIEDKAEIAEACERAIDENPRIEEKTLRFVRDILLGEYPESGASDEHKALVNEWAIAFQQYSGAVMAKGVEDTTFYTYNRLAALNEVGGMPERFGTDVAAFHKANQQRLHSLPNCLVTTSTHDTKVSEDVRARLYALSEIPHDWRQWLQVWREHNAPNKTWINGRWAPDSNEEYRLYQMLIGAWPQGAGEPDKAFCDRMVACFKKAVCEAKVNSTLASPNPEWLEACEVFVRESLRSTSPFVASIRTASSRLACCGVVNSLAQVVLKLTVPGVPDLYQGNETWDFSLVDPDNRRPVDFSALLELADQVARSSNSPREVAWATQEIKWRLTQRILQFRASHAELFSRGDYLPLSFDGKLHANLVGFTRRQGEDEIAVIVPRLVADQTWPPVAEVWTATTVSLRSTATEWLDIISGHRFTNLTATAPLDRILSTFPVAILHASGARTQHT